MDIETIKEVVDKLLGCIDPYGSTETDRKRKENLEKHIKLINYLIWETKDVAIHNKDRCQFSMREIGLLADGFLQGLVDELYEYGYIQNELKDK